MVHVRLENLTYEADSLTYKKKPLRRFRTAAAILAQVVRKDQSVGL